MLFNFTALFEKKSRNTSPKAIEFYDFKMVGHLYKII